jgi:hypothetical protein
LPPEKINRKIYRKRLALLVRTLERHIVRRGGNRGQCINSRIFAKVDKYLLGNQSLPLRIDMAIHLKEQLFSSPGTLLKRRSYVQIFDPMCLQRHADRSTKVGNWPAEQWQIHLLFCGLDNDQDAGALLVG